MQKFLRTLALVALIAVPWVANAQSGCTIKVVGEDSFGDGWNNGALTLTQNGSTVGSIGLTSGSIDSLMVNLTSTAPVTFTWSAGNYDDEVTIRIYDGSGTMVFSVTEPNTGVIYTMNTPCPTCLPPTNLTATGITDDGLTLHWTDAANTGNYSISYTSGAGSISTVTTTDTFYVFTGLNAATNYTFAVTAVCSSTDESGALTGSFRTDCSGGSCYFTVYRTDSYDDSWNGCLINIMQNGGLVASIDCPTGQSGTTASYQVCSGVPVTLTFTRGSYPGELGGYITDGGGVTVFTIQNMGNYQTGDVITTIANPCPSCIPPSNLAVMTDSSEIELSWTPNSGATLFAVYLNDSLIDDNVTDTTYTFQNLDVNTPYTVGVQAICSSSDSSNIATLSTRTTCGEMQLPYFEDFESVPYNGAWPDCWNLILNYNTDPSVNYNENHTPNGQYSMFMLAGNTYNMFASSAIPLAGDNIYVRFWARLVYGQYIYAGVMTNPADTSTFIPLTTVSGTVWTEYEFNTANLDPNATYYAAWKGYSTSYWSALGMVDDIYISEMPTCVRVTEVVLDSAASDELTIHWEDYANANADYTVTYWPSGTTDTSYTPAYDTTVTLTGLDASTAYCITVTANCPGGDAESSPVFTFRTACGDVTLPYFTDFEDIDFNGAAYPCWDTTIYAGTDPSVNYANDGDDHPGQYSYYFQGNSSQNYNLLVGPTMNAVGNDIYVRFDAKCSSGWIKAGVLTDPHDTSTFIPMVQISGNNWAEYEFNTANLSASANYRVAWLAYGSSYIGKIDNVNISEIPSCLRVTDFVVAAADSSSITLSWVDTMNGGATYTITLNDSLTVAGVTDTFYTFTNLEPNTSYSFTVAVECGSETSETQSVSGRTECGATPVPYVEGFEGQPTSATPYCWTNVSGTVYTRSASTHTGSNRLDFRGSADNMVILPPFTQELNTLQMTFWTRPESYSYASCGNFAVGYVTNVNDASTFVALETYAYNDWTASSYEEKTVMFSAAPAGARVAFRQFNCSSSYYWYVDDINIEPLPNCVPVSLVGVDTVTSDGATIYWTAPAGQTDFIVRLDSTDYNVQDTFYTFTGLTALTAYTAMVASDCGNDTSSWTNIAFTTACAGATCDITVSMVDSYGDGWNNAKLYFTQNGAFVGYVTISSGATATGTVSVCSGIPVVSHWQSGNYDTECSYIIFDGGGSEAYNSTTGSGVNYSATITDPCPSCQMPAGLTATAVSDNSITISWTSNANVDHYLVSFNGGTYVVPNNGTTSHTESGLNASTTYTFSVIAVCTPGVDTSSASVLSVATSCGMMQLPYFENFDAYPQDVLPPCWDYDQAGVTHWDGGLFFRSNSSGGTGAYAVVPPLAGNFSKLKVEFDTKVGTIAEQDGILIGAADATGTLVGWLDTIQDPNHSRNGFVHHIINMVNYYNIPAGASRLVFAQYRNWGEWALIDNLSIELLPDCYPVDSLEAHNLIDPDHTNFTWSSLGNESEWQVYVDTVTVDIDNIPDSLLTTVYSRYYEIPVGTIHGGGIYTFYVRANCGQEQSTWTNYTFGAGTYVMNNSATADTVVACGLVVYDNGGPIAGYLPNSNSALVVRSENVGSQLEVFGAAFGFGSSAATLTIYDGEGTNGAVLYTYSTIDGRDTLNSVLATSTNGALTITFVSSGQMCHTGYELYIHCVGTALCERPTQLNGTMTGAGQATVTWVGTSASYDLYYKPIDAATWTIQNAIIGTTTTLTGLLADTTYTLQVVGICGNDTSMPSFPAMLNTHFEVLPCDPVTNLAVGNVTSTTATLSWTSTADSWEIELSNVSGSTTLTTTNNPHTLTGLLPNMSYSARVRALCSGPGFVPNSEWSTAVTFHTDTVSTQGIEGVDGNGSFVLYPNPATTTVTIDLTGVEDAASISIIDLNGRQVYDGKAVGERMTINVASFAKGAYFVRVTGSNTTAVRKLIVK